MSKTSFPKEDSQDDQKPKIEDYSLAETLGRGTFGKVKLGVHKLTSQKVAVKILEKAKLGDPDFQKRVNREIKILQNFSHPHVINIYQVLETQDEFYMIMEYINGGELSDYIVAKKQLKEEEARRIFRQIICAVEALHKNGIAHRDLKPENILLDFDRNIKIIDFGLSNTYKPGELLKTACGSPCYAAPEMVAGRPYFGLGTDIWSCGIILFMMLCGHLPFEDKNTSRLYKKILEDEPGISKLISPEARDLLKNILHKQPTKRFTVKQIVEHPWYKMQKFAVQVQQPQQNTVNEVIIRNLEDYGADTEPQQQSAKENKVTHLSNLYQLLNQTQPKKGEKTSKNKAHTSLVTTKRLDEESSPYANMIKLNSTAFRSKAIGSGKTPKDSEKLERMNSLDRSLATEASKIGPKTSLEKIIAKEKINVKSPRLFEQEATGSTEGSQQKIQLKTSFIAKINDFKDAVNMISTRATSNSISEDTKRPKTERERKNIAYFAAAKPLKQNKDKDEKSVAIYCKTETMDSNRDLGIIENLSSSLRALSSEKGEASSLNSILNANDLNEDTKNPYGLFKPCSLKDASPQSATNKYAKNNKAYLSMKSTLKGNYITISTTTKKPSYETLNATTKHANRKERLDTCESILEKSSQIDSKPVRSFLKPNPTSIQDVKKLINNSFAQKPLNTEESLQTKYLTTLDGPRSGVETPSITKRKESSNQPSHLNWKQFDSRITHRQNHTFLTASKENSTKKPEVNGSILTSMIKQLPADAREARKRNNTPTKTIDVSMSDKFKGTVWPSSAVVVPCDEEQQTRLYNKFKKHMINM